MKSNERGGKENLRDVVGKKCNQNILYEKKSIFNERKVEKIQHEFGRRFQS